MHITLGLPAIKDVSKIAAPGLVPPDTDPGLNREATIVEDLRRENAEKTRLLAVAAHELRSPLASIRGLAEFLRDGAVGDLTPQQQNLVLTIHNASDWMLELVKELLDVSRAEAGAFKLQLEPCDVEQLIRQCINHATLAAVRKEMHVVFRPPATLPFIALDAAKMSQVIDNLLSNAIKYSPAGSRITVVLDVESTPGHCVIAVRDQGPGIADEERDALFQLFSRLSSKPTGGEQSSGVGLALCRKIVEAHRGSISAINLPAGGCEFRVALPAHA